MIDSKRPGQSVEDQEAQWQYEEMERKLRQYQAQAQAQDSRAVPMAKSNSGYNLINGQGGASPARSYDGRGGNKLPMTVEQGKERIFGLGEPLSEVDALGRGGKKMMQRPSGNNIF